MRQHRQSAVGFEVSDAAVNDRVGVGIIGIDAESLRQPSAIRRLDRGEAKALRRITRGDEANPTRAENADAVIEDHVIVGPTGHRLSNVSSATSISTIAGPVLTSAPSGSIQRSGVRMAAPVM